MQRDPDPIRSFLRILREPWGRADHRERLERRLLRAFSEHRTRVRRRFVLTGLTMASIAVVSAAYPTVAGWWEGWKTTETVLDDGTKHLVVTDPEGRIDFDEVLQPEDAVLLTDDGEYVIIEASGDGDAEAPAPADESVEEPIDTIIERILGERRADD